MQHRAIIVNLATGEEIGNSLYTDRECALRGAHVLVHIQGARVTKITTINDRYGQRLSLLTSNHDIAAMVRPAE